MNRKHRKTLDAVFVDPPASGQ